MRNLNTSVINFLYSFLFSLILREILLALQSMEESWINGQEVIPTNFAFFPLGICKIVVKLSKSEQHKRIASVQCSMKGLIFDIDSVS